MSLLISSPRTRLIPPLDPLDRLTPSRYASTTTSYSSVNSAVPLLCAPSDGTGAGTFDRNVYNKRSVVLRIDMSVTDPRINDDGDITLRGGLGLLETGAGSVWDDSNITAPELEEPAADTGGSDTTTTTGTT